MGERADGLREPRSQREYAVSAGDQLVLWHGRRRPGLLDDPLRTRAVVLLASCLADRAEAAGLEGPAVAKVPLADVVTVLDRYPDAVGGDIVDELLSAFGQPEFDAVRQAVRETLVYHLADSGPHARIADRRQAPVPGS
ncbi:hypothetical protein P6B95_38465 [Streptomyces atratus]|uniref:hypothetical protein n=1 Tax=Streptomyces atratus TaxID=1893 RepID=UPI0016712131|nr:hypothetical protein [Streptomyces atratus]WPW32681.1 hypothetical protein P6B95_38465 [Streptomyces atratus]GGT45435.1 hypothetical protein GCM10010207_52150 [Streptomyces atratus]